MAEETGLIVPVAAGAAKRPAYRRPSAGTGWGYPLTIAVNISAPVRRNRWNKLSAMRWLRWPATAALELELTEGLSLPIGTMHLWIGVAIRQAPAVRR